MTRISTTDARIILNQGIRQSAKNVLSVGLTCGGTAVLHHFTLRLLLYRDGYIPWNYARFLDYCARLILLRKVRGGYIFIHRLIQEYFASLEPKRPGGRGSGCCLNGS